MEVGFISEIFFSRQGEGLFTGDSQVFVRLAGCPFRCNYCDTPDSLSANGHAAMSTELAAEKVRQLGWQHKTNAVSITGGEPLTQVDFLKELLPLLKRDGFFIHLETAGVHHKELEMVVEWCDAIAMDIKLPSAAKDAFWVEHRRFLEAGGEKIFVKLVIEAHTKVSEVDEAIQLLAAQPKPPILIFQVVTPQGSVQAPSQHDINGFVQSAKERLPKVLVSTQKHKEWALP